MTTSSNATTLTINGTSTITTITLPPPHERELTPEQIRTVERVMRDNHLRPVDYKFMDGTVDLVIQTVESVDITQHHTVYFYGGMSVYQIFSGLVFTSGGGWRSWPESGGSSGPQCQHQFVNVGFSSIRMVCKFCDIEKPEGGNP